MSKTFSDEDDALLGELGVEVEVKQKPKLSERDERVLAGFEAIQSFVDQNGRLPQHGADNDIFERIYAVRLDRIRGLSNCRELLEDIDHQGLLGRSEPIDGDDFGELDDAELLEELGVKTQGSELTELKHVRSTAEKRAVPEEIGNRTKCEEFDVFSPLFERIRDELKTGVRTARAFEKRGEIEKGRFFIVGGQIAYVAEMDEVFRNEKRQNDARMRLIFDNGTESNMLMQSLHRRLNEDIAGRRITEPDTGPLFEGVASEEDQQSGTIYVLRSKSNNPFVAANRDLVHKIGVTGSSVHKRLAGAQLQSTYLMAEVELMATYDLFNINRQRLETLLHKFFGSAQIEIEIIDRFGNPVVPKEWFLVPLEAIDEAVSRIKDGTITQHRYDLEQARLVPA